ncbi:MAG TPA: hypothetical protein VGV93_04370 [Acidimicrobiales bacterium]|nr:hypothetical protein [Acidimicrobiales bacterium]
MAVDDRYSGIPCCHWCGASLPEPVEAPYCSPEHRRLARQAVDAGVVRELPETWTSAVRAHGNRMRATDGPGQRTKQRRRRAASNTT